jgi:hypothetical protein
MLWTEVGGNWKGLHRLWKCLKRHSCSILILLHCQSCSNYWSSCQGCAGMACKWRSPPCCCCPIFVVLVLETWIYLCDVSTVFSAQNSTTVFASMQKPPSFALSRAYWLHILWLVTRISLLGEMHHVEVMVWCAWHQFLDNVPPRIIGLG